MFPSQIQSSHPQATKSAVIKLLSTFIKKDRNAKLFTRSATFPISIMALTSLAHSKKVRRRFFPVTTVIGPLISCRCCFVYLCTSDLQPKVKVQNINKHQTFTRERYRISVVLPTPGGPTTATTTGGGTTSACLSATGI